MQQAGFPSPSRSPGSSTALRPSQPVLNRNLAFPAGAQAAFPAAPSQRSTVRRARGGRSGAWRRPRGGTTRQPASLCRLARGCEVSPVVPSPAAELGPASRRGLPLGALGWVVAPPSLPSPGCPRLPRARGPSAGGARPIGKRREAPAKVLKSLLARESPSGTPLVGLSSSDRPSVQGTRYQRIGFSA